MEIWQITALYFSFVAGISFFLVRKTYRDKELEHLFPHNWTCPDCGAKPGVKCLEYNFATGEVQDTTWFHSQRFESVDIENQRRAEVRRIRDKR
jgi:hypothetical protein